MPKPSSYLKSIHLYSEQFKQAWNEVKKINIPEEFADVNDVIVAGMGASIFGGKILKSVFERDKLLIPVTLLSDYHLPEYADEKTLVIVTSYSGNTEEMLSVFDEAWDRGCPIVVVTSGGRLQAKAEKKEVPIHLFKPKHNPSGAPRTGVGYTIGSTLGIFSKLEFLDFNDDSAMKAYRYMSSFTDILQEEERMPMQLAQKLLNRIPIFVTAEHLTSGSHIWRNFLNETSKHIGFTSEIPNMNHHFLDGLLFPKQNKDDFIFVYVMSEHYSAETKKRFNATRELTKKSGILDVSITLGGNGRFHELLELIVIGSLVSFNVSRFHGADPATNEMVDYLKAALSKK